MEGAARQTNVIDTAQHTGGYDTVGGNYWLGKWPAHSTQVYSKKDSARKGHWPVHTCHMPHTETDTHTDTHCGHADRIQFQLQVAVSKQARCRAHFGGLRGRCRSRMWLLVLLDVDDAYSQYLQAGESTRYIELKHTRRNRLPHYSMSTTDTAAHHTHSTSSHVPRWGGSAAPTPTEERVTGAPTHTHAHKDTPTTQSSTYGHG